MNCFRTEKVPFWVSDFEVGKLYCVSQTIDSDIIKDSIFKVLLQEAVVNKRQLLYSYDYVDNDRQFSKYIDYNELTDGYDIIMPYKYDKDSLCCILAKLHKDAISDDIKQIIDFVENEGLSYVVDSLYANDDSVNYQAVNLLLEASDTYIMPIRRTANYAPSFGSKSINISPRLAEKNELRTSFLDKLQSMAKPELKALLLQYFERMPPSERKRFLVDVSMYKTDTKVIIRKENYKTNNKSNIAFYLENGNKRCKVLFTTAAQNVLYLHCLLNLCSKHYYNNTDSYDEQRSAKIFKLLYESRKYPDPDLGVQKLSILTTNINNQLVNSTVLLKGHNVNPLMIRNMSVVADIENIVFENTSFSELQRELQ